MPKCSSSSGCVTQQQHHHQGEKHYASIAGNPRRLFKSLQHNPRGCCYRHFQNSSLKSQNWILKCWRVIHKHLWAEYTERLENTGLAANVAAFFFTCLKTVFCPRVAQSPAVSWVGTMAEQAPQENSEGTEEARFLQPCLSYRQHHAAPCSLGPGDFLSY